MTTYLLLLLLSSDPKTIMSRPNIFGGTNYHEKGGVTITRPNILGGENFHGYRRGYSRRNVFGGRTFYFRGKR